MFDINQSTGGTRRFDIAGVEQLEQLSVELGWDANYTQLAIASRAGSYLETVFDAAMVTCTAYPGPLSVTSSVPEGHVAISIYLSPVPAKFKGLDTSDDRIFIGIAGCDYQIITRGIGEGFTVVMPAHEIETRLGTTWSVLEQILSRNRYCSARVDAVAMDSLKRWYRQWRSNPFFRRGVEAAALQRCLYDALNETLSGLADVIELQAVKLGKDEISNKKIVELIDYFYACPDRPVTLEDMMRLTGMRRRTLFNRFRQFTGYTPYQYFTRLRLGFVHKGLLTESGSVTNLALQYNFNHLGDFSALYKRTYNELPSELRKRVVE